MISSSSTSSSLELWEEEPIEETLRMRLQGFTLRVYKSPYYIYVYLQFHRHNYMYVFSLFYFKMQSSDKDFRFMATNDLMTELQKDSIKLDDDSERKVVRMLLKLLEDKNGEVQNLAVKWYVTNSYNIIQY